MKNPPAVRDAHGRVPYMRLAEKEREALHEWCTLHDVDYTNADMIAAIRELIAASCPMRSPRRSRSPTRWPEL